MAHVAMAYPRSGDYERIADGGYNSREVQGNTSFYREGNNSHLDYLNFPRATEGNRVISGDAVVPDSGYFLTIAGVIGQVPDRLVALHLTEQKNGLGRPSSPSENLLQAIKAVEVAETTIIEQIQENEHLRNELQLTNWELQTYFIGKIMEGAECSPQRRNLHWTDHMNQLFYDTLREKQADPSKPDLGFKNAELLQIGEHMRVTLNVDILVLKLKNHFKIWKANARSLNEIRKRVALDGMRGRDSNYELQIILNCLGYCMNNQR